MRKLNIFIIASVVLTIVLLAGSVSAVTWYEREVYDKISNPIVKIVYLLQKGLFVFTTWGESNCCSSYPDETEWIEEGERIDCDDYCSYDKCALDIWYDDTVYLGGATGPPSYVDYDNWLGEESGEGEYFVGYVYPWYFVEVYCCPEACSIGDWETDVFVCDDYEWEDKGSYELDEYCPYDTSGVDLCWCNDEGENFYVDESGGVHCVEQDYSGIDNWCAPYEEEEDYFCYSNDIWWYDSDNERTTIKEDCGTLGCITGNEECREEDEEECNTKGESCIFDNQCCSDICTLFVCRESEDEEDEDEDDEDEDDLEGIGTAKTITWTEYYSIEDKKVLNSVCTSDSDCLSKTKYTVTCDKSEEIKERIFDANIQVCEDKTPGGLIGFLPDIFTQILIGESFCEFDQGISVWFNDLFGNEQPGLCIAESDTWYGGLWEGLLKIAGGMGLPAQYVLVITIMLLITIIGFGVRMFT